MFKNKILLITGGTGSFGKTILRKFIDSDLKEIRIFSRDEKKQHDLSKDFPSEKVKFFIGNVRDKDSLRRAFKNVDFIFHAAALKQVPTCEYFPIEAVKTNVIGTSNVLDVANDMGVKRVVCLSTDKAAYPINAMGMSKAIMEKVALAKANEFGTDGPIVTCTRYGNVMGSRGSVIPLFYKLIEDKKPLTITNGDMTRFMMTLDDAADLVLYAFENGVQGDTFIQKSPSSTVDVLAKAILKYKKADNKIIYTGLRPGEKVYEVLVTSEEMQRAMDEDKYYRIKNSLAGNNKNIKVVEEYSSNNTTILDVEQVIDLLKKAESTIEK